MNFSSKILRFIRCLPVKIASSAFQRTRKLLFWLLCDCRGVVGKPICNQPLLCKGQGQIVFDGNVCIGVSSSPGFLNGYAYLEARKERSRIKIGKAVWVNNNFSAISEGDGISIGEKTLIGTEVCIYDSDFHELSPSKRQDGVAVTKPVFIGSNVFIGSRVIVLKGVTIGDNSVIAAGSIVSKDVPPNVIAGGNPCRIIRSL